MVWTTVPWTMWPPDGYRPGRWRLVGAVAASLLLHAVLLWRLVLPASAVRVPEPPARQAMEVLWITAPQAAAPVSRTPAPEPVAAQASRSARPRPGPVREGRSVRPPAALALPQDTGPGLVAMPAPVPAASDARDVPAIQWSPEGVARAARQEREWQRRHGSPAAAALAANAASPAPRPLGTLTEKEWQNTYAGRVTRVESEAGVYCVRLPSANRLPEQGAAPRIATVTNC